MVELSEDDKKLILGKDYRPPVPNSPGPKTRFSLAVKLTLAVLLLLATVAGLAVTGHGDIAEIVQRLGRTFP